MTYSGECSVPLDTNWGKMRESDLDHVLLKLQRLDSIRMDQQ